MCICLCMQATFQTCPSMCRLDFPTQSTNPNIKRWINWKRINKARGVKKRQPQSKKMRVMVAIDDSEESFYALNWALDNLFRDMGAPPEGSGGGSGGGGSKVVPALLLVNVQQALQPYGIPVGPVGGAAFYPAVSVMESVKKAQEQISATILSRALQMCKDKMVITETLSLNGNPKDEICQAIEQKHADLLIVGSRGLGKIKRAFLGSVSNYCAHHAKCPVLIVKSPKDHERS